MAEMSLESVNEYKKYLIDEEKSSVTVEKYIRDIIAFSKWIGTRELTKSEVLEYKEELTEKYAPTSVNSILASLNGFFSYMEWFALKVKNLKIQRKIFCGSEKELSKSEYERLLKAANDKKNDKIYHIMQTICSTGIRVSELKFITVEALTAGQTTVRMKGKFRTIILPKELCRLLKKYAAEHAIKTGSIFITRTGKPIDRHSVWKCMKQLCETANVAKEKVFPHNLRHLFARTYYSLQNDIVRLADILGHSSINTTRIYTMESVDIHRKQIQKLGLLRC